MQIFVFNCIQNLLLAKVNISTKSKDWWEMLYGYSEIDVLFFKSYRDDLCNVRVNAHKPT